LRDYHEPNRESLIKESLPLLTCSKSADVLGDGVQHTTDGKFDNFFGNLYRTNFSLYLFNNNDLLTLYILQIYER